MGLSGFARMSALSTRNDEPQRASRPFDSDRDGFVIAEGAGMVVLEEFEIARRRGATILAEVLGYGMTADGNHMTAPDPEGRRRARAMAPPCATRISPRVTSATSTPTARALRWGTRPRRWPSRRSSVTHARKLAISSTKSQFGHLLGASGGVEFVVAVLSL